MTVSKGSRTMRSEITDDQIRKVVSAVVQGADFERIDRVPELGLAPGDAEAIWKAYVRERPPDFDRTVELERINSLMRTYVPLAIKGDGAAADRVVRLGERAERLTAKPARNQRKLRKAFDATVRDNPLIDSAKDHAIIETAGAVFDRIDAAMATGDGAEVTKALYLIPHAMNALDRMLATPSARLNAEIAGANKAAGEDSDKSERGRAAMMRSQARATRLLSGVPNDDAGDSGLAG